MLQSTCIESGWNLLYLNLFVLEKKQQKQKDGDKQAWGTEDSLLWLKSGI